MPILHASLTKRLTQSVLFTFHGRHVSFMYFRTQKQGVEVGVWFSNHELNFLDSRLSLLFGAIFTNHVFTWQMNWRLFIFIRFSLLTLNCWGNELIRRNHKHIIVKFHDAYCPWIELDEDRIQSTGSEIYTSIKSKLFKILDCVICFLRCSKDFTKKHM